jgi:hypothetical protein
MNYIRGIALYRRRYLVKAICSAKMEADRKRKPIKIEGVSSSKLLITKRNGNEEKYYWQSDANIPHTLSLPLITHQPGAQRYDTS